MTKVIIISMLVMSWIVYNIGYEKLSLIPKNVKKEMCKQSEKHNKKKGKKW